MTHHTSASPPSDSYDVYDLSQIFIGRQHQLDRFDYYLSLWQQLLLTDNPNLDPPVMSPPSPNNKLQSLIVFLYGGGGFGKSTLLRRYHDIALQESRHLATSKIIDWEFAVEGQRGLFNPPPGQDVEAAEYFRVLCSQLAIALNKDTKTFKTYQTAVKAVDDARKKASGILDSMRQDDRYGWLRGLTVETITNAIRATIPPSGLVLENPTVKKAADEIARLTQEQISHIRTRLHDRLGSALGDYLDPTVRLGLALGGDLSNIARNFPLLIFFDTYEEIDEADRLLRIVMGAAGMRVGWVLASRDNLWSGPGQRNRSLGLEYGYKDLVLSDRGLSVNFNADDIGAFTISEITEYFAQLSKQVRHERLPSVTEVDAARIFDVTQGVPLAIKIAATLYLETTRLETITADVEGKREIVDRMVRRYLLHTRADQSEKLKLYGLALLRRVDQPSAVAAALGLTPEQAQIGYEQELSRLHRRYSFVFTEKERPMLHKEVHHFLRLWLLEHRKEPEIVAINQRLKDVHETALHTLEERRQYASLQERLQDDEWVGTYLDLAEQQFWFDPVEGVRSLLPFMLAAAIYRRDVNEDVSGLGTFFHTALGSTHYRTWWIWANQSLIYLHNYRPSLKELGSLEKLEQLASQQGVAFPHPLPGYRKELAAALWWRLGEAWSFRDANKALVWYEKALTQLAHEDELRTATAVTYREVAYTLYEQQNYRECLQLLDKAILLKPDYAAAYNARGVAYDNLEEYRQAIVDYDRAIALDPDDSSAYNNRGLSYSNLEEYQRAIEDYDRAIALDPKDAKAYYNRGNTHRIQKEHQRAIADFDQAIALNPNNAKIYTNRGLAYEQQGEHQRAIADYDHAIALDPNLAVAYYNRGLTYDHLQNYQRAIEDYDRAIALDPKDAKAYNNRGLLHYIQGEYQRAIEDCDQAIVLDPNASTIYNTRGIAYFELDEYQWAIADFDQAITLDPNFALACFDRGLAYAYQKDYRRAIEDFDQAIALDPNNARAYYNRGLAYDLLQDYQHAIADYDYALTQDPNLVDAYYNRGLTYLHDLQQYEQAIADFDQVITLNPNSGDTYFARGLAFLRLHNTRLAHSDFSRSYDLDPNHIDAAWMAVWTALGKQRPSIETAARLEQIAAIDLQDYLSYVCRGVALGLRGQLKAGLATLEQAILLESGEWDAYFWKGMLSAYYYQVESQEPIILAPIEQALQVGLPPVLLMSLYWLKQDRSAFFATYLYPLLERYGL